MSYIFNDTIQYKNTQQLDSFGRLRTSEVSTLFDSPLKHHGERYIWNTIETNSGSGTYSTTETLYLLSVTSTGDKVIRQTKQYFQLQNGKSHVGFMGMVFDGSTGITQRAGVYDDENGFYIKHDGTGVSLVIRSKVSGTVQEATIPQSSWNMDVMDGNGISGINIDFTKMQIICFDMSYTGAGSIHFGFLVDGAIYYAHKHSSHNAFSTNSLTTPSLPVRYEIESTGGSGTFKQQSSCILVEGRYDKRGIVRTVDTGTTAKSVGTTLTPVLSLKLKAEYRTSVLKPLSFNVLQTSTNSTLYYAIYIFSSITNPSWQTAQLGTDCLAEYDTSATAITDGVKIASGYLPAKAAFTITEDLGSILALSGNYDGTTDIITIAISGVDGTVPCFVSLKYNEVY